jgi:hypothetical protein
MLSTQFWRFLVILLSCHHVALFKKRNIPCKWIVVGSIDLSPDINHNMCGCYYNNRAPRINKYSRATRSGAFLGPEAAQARARRYLDRLDSLAPPGAPRVVDRSSSGAADNGEAISSSEVRSALTPKKATATTDIRRRPEASRSA